MQEREDRWSRVSVVVIGLLLIGVGVLFLAVQSFGYQLPFDLGNVGWPLFIIAPGMVLLVVGLTLPAAPGVSLASAGAIVTTVGLLLAYQSAYGHYASWAYAWTLVAPTSVGAAMVIWSLLHGRGDIARAGLGALAVGLILFLVGFAFFEGMLNIGGGRGFAGLGRQALPVALIAAGVLIIAARLWPSSRRGWDSNAERHRPAADAPPTSEPPPGP